MRVGLCGLLHLPSHLKDLPSKVARKETNGLAKEVVSCLSLEECKQCDWLVGTLEKKSELLVWSWYIFQENPSDLSKVRF